MPARSTIDLVPKPLLPQRGLSAEKLDQGGGLVGADEPWQVGKSWPLDRAATVAWLGSIVLRVHRDWLQREQERPNDTALEAAWTNSSACDSQCLARGTKRWFPSSSQRMVMCSGKRTLSTNALEPWRSRVP